MPRAIIATLCAAALLAALPLLSATAAPSTTQEAQPGITSDGPKLPPIYGGEVQEEGGPEAADGGVVTPLAVSRSGCINFPGQKRSYSLSARGRITYRVVPSRFFDVTLRVNYTTIASSNYFVDRFFAGGTESIVITSFPTSRFYPVRVTIGGFRSSTGCFFFTSNP